MNLQILLLKVQKVWQTVVYQSLILVKDNSYTSQWVVNLPLKCFYKTLDLHLKVENCLQSDKSCEVPKLNFSSLMLWIWVGVCTPDNGPHMFTDPVEELKLDPLTDLDLLHTLRPALWNGPDCTCTNCIKSKRNCWKK